MNVAKVSAHNNTFTIAAPVPARQNESLLTFPADSFPPVHMHQTYHVYCKIIYLQAHGFVY